MTILGTSTLPTGKYRPSRHNVSHAVHYTRLHRFLTSTYLTLIDLELSGGKLQQVFIDILEKIWNLNIIHFALAYGIANTHQRFCLTKSISLVLLWKIRFREGGGTGSTYHESVALPRPATLSCDDLAPIFFPCTDHNLDQSYCKVFVVKLPKWWYILFDGTQSCSLTAQRSALGLESRANLTILSNNSPQILNPLLSYKLYLPFEGMIKSAWIDSPLNVLIPYKGASFCNEAILEKSRPMVTHQSPGLHFS